MKYTTYFLSSLNNLKIQLKPFSERANKENKTLNLGKTRVSCVIEEIEQ